MEALLLVLLEAIAGPLLAAAGAILAFLSELVVAAGSLAFARFLRRRPAAPGEPEAPAPRRWPRMAATAVGTLGALAAVGLVVVDVWYFEAVARYVLAKQRERTGTTIEAAHIVGSIFTGRIVATDVVVRRDEGPGGRIDLRVGSVRAVVRVWDVLGSPREIEQLTLVGVRGRCERRAPAGTNPGIPKGSRPAFVVTNLSVEDLEVTWVDTTTAATLEVPLAIRTFTVAPLRSRWAVFDLLFRGNGDGTVASRPFTVTTTGDDTARETQWRADGLPIGLLAAQVGGPFTLFTAGTANVHVVDRWQRADGGLAVAMDWSIVLDGVTAAVPEGASPLIARLAHPVAEHVNRHRGPLPLTFHVAIDEQRFEGSASTDAADLWQVAATAAAQALAERVGVGAEAVEAAARGAAGAAKDLLDTLRRKKGK